MREPGWSGTVIGDGSGSNKFKCNACGLEDPCYWINKKLSDEDPTGCIDLLKREEKIKKEKEWEIQRKIAV